MSTIRTLSTSLFAAVALIVGLSACRKEAPEQPVPANAVEFTASISEASPLRVNSLDDTGATFEEGDEIYITANAVEGYRGKSTYRLDGNGKWEPKAGNPYILWMGDELYSKAYYPASAMIQAMSRVEELGMSARDIFYTRCVPTDQSTREKLSKADLMISASVSPFFQPEVVRFGMQRQTMKLTLGIKKFNNQYPSGVKVESVRFILTDSRGIRATETYIPYTDSDGSAGSTYTILLPVHGPVELKTHDQLRIAIKPVEHPEVSVDLSTLYTQAEIGHHYKVNVTVGKDRAEVGEVSILDWNTTQNIPGAEADMLPIIDLFRLEEDGAVILNLDQAANYDEVKTKLDEAIASLRAEGENISDLFFVVKGPASNFFKEGLSLFYRTEVANLHLGDLTGLTSLKQGDIDLTYLKHFVAPRSVTTIEPNAFQNASSLEVVQLDNVTAIGNEAFFSCVNLSQIYMDKVRTIGTSSFEGCNKLLDIKMEEVETIGDRAFFNCSELGQYEIDIPKARILGADCFNGCYEGAPGESLIINLGVVEEMGARAFTVAAAQNTFISVPVGQQRVLEWNSTQNKSLPHATEQLRSGEDQKFGFFDSEITPLVWKRISFRILETL